MESSRTFTRLIITICSALTLTYYFLNRLIVMVTFLNLRYDMVI